MALPPTQTPYSPGDFTALRKDIFDQAIKAIVDSSRVENDNYVLSLDGVEYDGGVPEYSKRDQKNAVYNNKSLSASIRGRWVLTDKATGQVVSKSSLRKLMEVPYLTERGTFIRNGSEVTLPIQMRLVPGIYAIMGENGEAKAQINTQPGTGRAMQITMNPANPVFKLKAGTRNYSLYPILKHAGVKDTDLQEAWGKEIFDANYKDFVKGGGWYTGDRGDNPDDNPYERIAQDVFGGKIDPINAKMTFGEAFDTIDPNVLTKTSTRLLALTRGEIDSDNRDSLENQRFVMAPEMIAERIRKDAGGTMRNILWKATKDGNVDRIPPAALSRYIHSLFTDSGLSQVIEETNLLDAYQRATKITRMGEGGIGSIDSAPMSSRMVHNTYKAFVDPVSSVESLRVGLDTQAAINVLKGNDGLIYSPLINAVSGRKQLVSSIESSVVPVAFAEYRNSTLPVIPAMVGNSLQYLPRKDIKYFVPNGDSLFSLSSNLVPMKAGIKAGRLLMAQKHQTQAMALSDRMAPYVQTLDPSGENVTVEQKYGNIMGAIRAGQEGKVLDVTPDEITVRQGDGTTRKYSLYDNFPLNRRSLVTNIPSVTKGDMIKPGQLLAASNYTDKDGTSALGTQLRTGWLSYKGHNNLDGIVISESAAKRLTSEYLYHHDKDKEDGVQFGKDLYVGAFPTKFTKAQLDTIDDTGAAKPGTILHKGDPIILAMSKRVPGPQTLYRTLSKDDAVTWENEFPGKVLDVVDGKDGIKVFTEAQVPAQVGDKISTRFASKGTIALILPDDKMPRNKDGEALQVLLSPTGIVSRVNSAQLVEAALGKVSAKTGKTYKLPGFMDESLIDFAERELKAAGLEDKEDLIDPETGNIIPQVKTGNSYIIKFHHTSESKEGARSTGGYSADELPSGSGHDSAKTLGGLLLGAFVGHDSSEVLKDMKLVKGQRNDEFWRDFRSGRTPRTPNSPLIYDKFLAHLEASGIRVKREGDDTNIFAMTNDDVKTFTNGEVTSADTFTSKTFTPAKGGLFDPAIFGPNGDQWGYMTLPEPIPNPVMEDVIKVILNVTEDEYRGILGGIKKLPDGSTGAAGLKNYLSTINPKVGIANALQVVRSGKGAKRDKAVKQLRYYTAMDRHGVTPDDFMLDRIPVLPPRFRRVTESGGMMMIPDANYLYKAMKDTADDYVQAKEAGLPPDALAAGRLRVYDAFKAITGLGDPTMKALQEKEVGGLLKWVFGKGSPKFGGFQRSVVGGKLDVSGRAVIDIDPSLRLDEVGLPEGQAWDLYKDFIIRKLAQAGMPVLQATREVANKSDRAKEMMKRVMNERPLIMTRAPALHKFSVVALKPKLIEGHTLMLNPVIEGPLNADVDGDAVTYYVPVSKNAVRDAYQKMMPSKNLLSARNFTAHYLPQEEYILGAYLSTRKGTGPVKRTFKTEQEAIQAYKRGEIDVDDNVQITG